MLPCDGCGYKRTIPGDCHLACAYHWTEAELATLLATTRISARVVRWFRFPLNFDPRWGPDTCAARATEADSARLRPTTPLEEFLRLLAGYR